MKNKKTGFFALLATCFAFTYMQSCAIVPQGNVGVKRTLGKFSPRVLGPGVSGVMPFFSRVIIVPIRTVNRELTLDLPSKEGLTVNCDISILYRIRPDQAVQVLEEIGPFYERAIIVNIFRSAASDVCSRFFAKDMHSVKRAEIEKEIAKHMNDLLNERGFEVEAVLMKSIKLPAGLSRAIELKLESEQRAQQMEFELQRERQEAERKRIAAEGTRDAQRIISEGLSEEVIRWQSLEVFRELSRSPNSKIIMTDGSTPFLLKEK